VAGAIIGVALAWFLWAALLHSTPAVQSKFIGFRAASDTEVSAKFMVSREATDTPATCRLQALGDDHSTVGELSVTVDSGSKEQVIEVTLRTEQRATGVTLVGCTTPDQVRPR
jgi:hypothetical protein